MTFRNKNLFLTFLFFLLFQSQNLFANSNKHSNNVTSIDSKEINIDQMSLQMILHENPGCPEGSICSKKMGALRQSWISVLQNNSNKTTSGVNSINQFIKKNGLLITGWLLSDELKETKNLILWNSRCENHRTETNNILELKFFTQSTKKTSFKNKNIQLDQIWIKNNAGKVFSFHVPAREIPVAFDNNKVLLSLEEEENYFQATIDQDGNLNIISYAKIKNFPKEIDCPEDFVYQVKEQLKIGKLYKRYYCKQVWDLKGKPAGKILLPLSC